MEEEDLGVGDGRGEQTRGAAGAGHGRGRVLRVPMAEPAKPEVTEEAKMDLLEDDDEFEEFEIDQEWDDKEEGNEALQQWEDDWDDDDVNDDFSLQLRKELESNASKN
ncbi:unnamed protein product [Miscanthus lutarioriparius]|uniref:26S proteasome complex subunit SEM1 n=2 Tax=Miscanthus lutarioriparius TaxID=422564 RepID=A0A811P701_9POAL|nr:unnamed protein product [Miscanthus lutarioriparius]